ncbi:MAG: hypothetical protein IJ654_09975, partial [Bacteroidales bacterium]|nr:hypothetical protein [Bacteroidales bacterium]
SQKNGGTGPDHCYTSINIGTGYLEMARKYPMRWGLVNEKSRAATAECGLLADAVHLVGVLKDSKQFEASGKLKLWCGG